MKTMQSGRLRRTLSTFLLLAGAVLAQSPAEILDSSRYINWSETARATIHTDWPACRTGQAGVTVPVAAYTGSAATLNAAIANCAAANPSGSYLSLVGGTFTFDGNNVTGATSTAAATGSTAMGYTFAASEKMLTLGACALIPQ